MGVLPRLHDERRELSDLVGELRRVFRQVETLLVGENGEEVSARWRSEAETTPPRSGVGRRKSAKEGRRGVNDGRIGVKG